MAKKSLGKVIKVHSSGISETDKGFKISKVFNYGEEIEFDDKTKQYSIKEGTKSSGTKAALEKRIDDLLEEKKNLEEQNLDLVKQIEDLTKGQFDDVTGDE